MKTRTLAALGRITLCLGLFAVLDTQAKSGKGNGNGNGPSAQSNKGNNGKGNGNGNGNANSSNPGNSGNSSNKNNNKWDNGNSSDLLSPFDAIRAYLAGYRSEGRSGLPPGLAKKVARGGDLPPGWQKKVGVGQFFPDDLLPFTRPFDYSGIPRFRPPGPNTDLLSIGNRVVQVDRPSRRITDVFDLD